MKPSRKSLPPSEQESLGKAKCVIFPPRLLFWLVVAFIGGMVCARAFPWTAFEHRAVFIPALFLLGLVLGRFWSRAHILHALLFLALFWGLGISVGAVAESRLSAPPDLLPFFERPQTLFLAEVISPPEFYPDKVRLPLRLHRAFTDQESLPVEGGVLLTLSKTPPSPAVWLLGDRLLVRLTLKPFHNFNNPGGYDYVRSQAEKGLYARAHVANSQLVIKLPPDSESFSSSLILSAKSGLDRFRQRARFWLKDHLKPDTADFYASLLLGYRVPKSWREHLSRAGVTHLLAISGLHLGLVSMSTFWLFCRLVRLFFPSLLSRTSDRHLALWAAFFSALLYALVSGLALPTWRSLVMLALLFGGICWYRHPDSLSALAAAALVILLISPNSLWNVSFHLSFSAMFGLFIVYPRFRRIQNFLWNHTLSEGRLIRKLLTPFVDAFWVSLAANVMVLPIVAYHFHGISLAGFVANTVLVPAVGFLVLPIGLTSLALFAVNEHLALPVLEVGAWFLGYCECAILWFSGLSWAFFWVGAMPLVWLMSFFAGLGLILSPWSRRVKASGIVALALVLLAVTALKSAPVSYDNRRTLRAVIIDVGQGSSTLVSFPTGETMLIDGGGFFDDSFDIGRLVLAPFLWHSGIKRLDYVVLSHDHPDHRNGLHFILSHFDVGCFWESGIAEDSGGFDELAAIASRRKIPILQLPEIIGDHEIGGCRVRILHPTPSYLQAVWDGEDLNNASLVLQVDYGDTHLIIPGDIDQSVERYLFADRALAGQVLLVSAHHGSVRSNSTLLLDRLQPRAIIFSCGYDNLFGFPSPVVLEECRRRDIPFYRTDLHGAIEAFSDGHRWTDVKGAKLEEGERCEVESAECKF